MHLDGHVRMVRRQNILTTKEIRSDRRSLHDSRATGLNGALPRLAYKLGIDGPASKPGRALEARETGCS